MKKSYLNDRIFECDNSGLRTIIVNKGFKILYMNKEFIDSFLKKFKFVHHDGNSFFTSFPCFQGIQAELEKAWNLSPFKKQTIDKHFHIDGVDKFIRLVVAPKALDGVVVGYFFTVISQSAKQQKQQLMVDLEQANEELKTINEELETTNENLADKNEQLITANEALMETQSKLAHANNDKDKLMRLLVHDLRSPLNGIKGFADLLACKTYESEEQMNSFMQCIIDSADKMLLLIDAINEWYHAESLIAKPKICTLINHVSTAVTLSHTYAEQKGIKLFVHIMPDIMVHTDTNMLDAVLRNLISNAIKFTHSGGRITLSAKRIQDHAQISVEDTGTGIASQYIEKIFDINGYRSKGTNDEETTGLGLIICRSFVEKNRGKLHIESELGKGSIFSFTLPRQ